MITKSRRVEKNFYDLSFNSRLLFKELANRQISLKRIRRTHIVRASYKKHAEVFYDIYSNLVPYTKGLIIDDKFYAKKFLTFHGFPVNEGMIFQKKDTKLALKYSKKIGFPVVLKPSMSSHGDNVVMNIENVRELSRVIKNFLKKYMGDVYFLIEKQFVGEEYRLFVTKEGFFAGVHRVPATIVGDGKRSIKDLVRRENYRRMHPRNTCLCIIPLDSEVMRFLKRKKITLKYVPKDGEKVQLRQNSNVSTGGNCFEITKTTNPYFVNLSKKILKVLDVPFVGIDLITPDISKKDKNFVICELNSAPGLSLHMMPEGGEPRNVAGAIADVMFPETKNK